MVFKYFCPSCGKLDALIQLGDRIQPCIKCGNKEQRLSKDTSIFDVEYARIPSDWSWSTEMGSEHERPINFVTGIMFDIQHEENLERTKEMQGKGYPTIYIHNSSVPPEWVALSGLSYDNPDYFERINDGFIKIPEDGTWMFSHEGRERNERPINFVDEIMMELRYDIKFNSVGELRDYIAKMEDSEEIKQRQNEHYFEEMGNRLNEKPTGNGNAGSTPAPRIELCEIFQLKHFMEEISEECYCAGWMTGLEFALWEATTLSYGMCYSYGMSVITSEKIQKLKELSEKANGWWAWDDYFNCCVFIQLEDWKEIIKDRQAGDKSACMNKPKDSDMYVSSTIEDWMEKEACNNFGCQSKQCKEFKLILMREANALYKELNNDKVELKKLKDLLARSVTTLQVRTCLCCNPFDEDWLKLRDEITEYLECEKDG